MNNIIENIKEEQRHECLIPFYTSRGIEELGNQFENKPVISFVIKNSIELIAAITCSKIEDIYIIEAIAVKENYEGMGIGTKLLKYTVEYIERIGGKNIILNAKNSKFFEMNNFIKISKENVPVEVYSYCLNCPDYEKKCFPTIMVYK